MDPQLFIRAFFAIAFLLVGLSHLLQPRLWADAFRDVFARPHGPLLIALYTGPMGITIVLLHNVWVARIPVLVTLVGWGMLIKSAAYFLWPGVARRVAPEKVRGANHFRIAGVVCIVVAALVGLDVLVELNARP